MHFHSQHVPLSPFHFLVSCLSTSKLGAVLKESVAVSISKIACKLQFLVNLFDEYKFWLRRSGIFIVNFDVVLVSLLLTLNIFHTFF